LYSDSTMGFPSGLTTQRDNAPVLDKYIIQEEDVKQFAVFWNYFSDKLPKSLYWPTGSEDHTTIAYKRYVDGLMQNGVAERRIANAIMGLEALLLKPQERQGVLRKLRTRTGKLLSNLKYEKVEVIDTINDAYEIRSTFVHGGQLNDSSRKKLEDRYRQIGILTRSVLDYLRICILVYLTLQMDKDTFINLIDVSPSDEKSEEQLESVLDAAKDVLGITNA